MPPTTKSKANKAAKLATATKVAKGGKARVVKVVVGVTRVKTAKFSQPTALADQVQDALAWLKRRGTKRTRDGMAGYGIFTDKAFGVPMATMRQLAKRLGRNHSLAGALWATGWYEARTVASFVADPAQVTPAQMDLWCRDFDNWAICDTVCFHLFDRTPHAWRKVAQWSSRRDEFGKRAGFALLACLALHDKSKLDQPYADSLALVEAAASDQRNFVKKAVSWALRAIGRRTPALNAAAVTVARRLALSTAPSASWIGRDAIRELTAPVMLRRLAATRHDPAI